MTNLTAGLLAGHTPKGPTGRSAALIDIAQDLLLNRLADLGLSEHLVFKGHRATQAVRGQSREVLHRSGLLRPARRRRPASVTELLTEAIDGLVIDEFSYSVHLRRGRPIVAYQTPFGGAQGLSTKLDIGPPPWLPVTRRGWVKLPVHAAYPTPATLPVMALVENMARADAVQPGDLFRGKVMMTTVTSAANEPTSATEQVVRRHAAELAELAAHHGIHDLRFASAGRLLGRVDPDRDMLDMAAFAADAEDLLGAPVSLLSDAVLGKANVSLDLVHATAL